jgi:hypothetical protein
VDTIRSSASALIMRTRISIDQRRRGMKLETYPFEVTELTRVFSVRCGRFFQRCSLFLLIVHVYNVRLLAFCKAGATK